MHASFLAAGLLVAALLVAVLTVQPFGSGNASGRRPGSGRQGSAGEPGESVEEVSKELLEPADALLGRWLYGSDKGVDPGEFWAVGGR